MEFSPNLLVNGTNLPVNSNLEVQGAKLSFLFASEVREPMAPIRWPPLICCRPRVCTVTMDMESMNVIDIDLRVP